MVRIKIFSVLAFLLVSVAVINAQDFQDLKNSMKNTVEFLASDSLQGRKFGGAGERAAAAYIYNKLSEYGVTMLSPAGGDSFYMIKSPGDTVKSANVIGIVEGYDPKLRNEFIVIGAHYDHLGTNLINCNGLQEKQIFKGADDNASGVAVVMELAKMIDLNKYMFKRSVIFAFFGGKEEGMSGSWYFVNRSFKEIDSVVMMINLDMVGRSSGGNSLYAQTAVKNVELSNAIKSISQRYASIDIQEATNSEHLPSDHIMFYEKGVPVVMFTSGKHKDFHSVFDTPDKLDYNQMAFLVDYVYAFTQLVADSSNKPFSNNMLDVKTERRGEEIFYSQRDVDKCAQFMHGSEQQFLSKWVYQYLKYPKNAVKEGISGTVVVEFVVDKSGNVRDVNVVKSVAPSLDDEAVKVVSSSPKWKPAEYNGEKVNVKTSVPIEFRLTNRGGIKLKKW